MTRDEYDHWVSDREAECEARRERENLTARSDARYVFSVLPRCPQCNGTHHRSYRSIDQGDGSRTRWTKCQTCGTKFILILT